MLARYFALILNFAFRVKQFKSLARIKHHARWREYCGHSPPEQTTSSALSKSCANPAGGVLSLNFACLLGMRSRILAKNSMHDDCQILLIFLTLILRTEKPPITFANLQKPCCFTIRSQGSKLNPRKKCLIFMFPVTNAFVANGIVNHNSGKTFMAAVAATYMCFVQADYLHSQS